MNLIFLLLLILQNTKFEFVSNYGTEEASKYNWVLATTFIGNRIAMANCNKGT